MEISTSSVLQRGGRVAIIESEVRDENDALVAKGLSTYMILKPRPAKER